MTNLVINADFQAPQPLVQAERAERLAALVSAGHSSIHYVALRDSLIEAPIVAADDALLVYRADNGRLFSELVSLGLSRDQQDSAEEQNALHGLLLEKANDPDGPIFEELAQRAVQTEPLLVSAGGIVVNGNRRLASMRELRARDPRNYSDFGTISVAVLPADLDAADIEHIEAALQLAPDLKLDYSWINRRLKLRDHVERLRLPREEIAHSYRFESTAGIERELGELDLAERFLRYRGSANQFELVADLEEAFVSMKRELDQFDNRKIVELWTWAGFAMIAARNDLQRPLEQHFPFTRATPFEFIHWGLRSLAEDLDLIPAQRPGENKPVDRLLAEALEPHLRDYSHSANIAVRLEKLSDRLRAEADTMIGAAQLLANLGKARKNVVQLDPVHVTDAQINEIRNELAAINAGIERLSPGPGTEPAKAGLLRQLFGS